MQIFYFRKAFLLSSRMNEHEFGHESQRDLKPRITVLARASSKLLHCTALSNV
jgi:hypothetical protein